ncbi:tetratricopeptide repeat protein [Gaetbulibacter saemankumensis]|uniref:tetratricopeptide repeat protein n=1 Tax=Gaetbulibacter saemankumensis TaxID=311208 RepID=UPI0003FFB3EF|nr:tetratricopeptide repeat protein [Gaetbulibacter saemankumensis]
MKKLVLLIAFSIVCNYGYSQSKKLFRLASKTENLQEKIDLYTQIITLEPKNLDAYFYRGLAKNNSGDYLGAIVDYSKIILIDPDADTYYNRANSRYSIKDFEGALEDYKKAYETDPNFVAALYSLGCVKYDLGQYEEAIKDFTKVIKATPYNPKTYFIRAASYEALEYYNEAAKDYTLAIMVSPTADSYYNRGVFYLSINYYSQANDDFNISLKLNKKNSYTYFYRGVSQFLLGKFNNAVSDFQSALEFDSLDFDAMLGLAICLSYLDHTEQAKMYLDKASNIINVNSNNKNLEDYQNTYWYQNRLQYLQQMLEKLNNI